jgi:hypothetical protein
MFHFVRSARRNSLLSLARPVLAFGCGAGVAGGGVLLSEERTLRCLEQQHSLCPCVITSRSNHPAGAFGRKNEAQQSVFVVDTGATSPVQVVETAANAKAASAKTIVMALPTIESEQNAGGAGMSSCAVSLKLQQLGFRMLER